MTDVVRNPEAVRQSEAIRGFDVGRAGLARTFEPVPTGDTDGEEDPADDGYDDQED
jgi:hypothetical protein